jgi:hypothetical protein
VDWTGTASGSPVRSDDSDIDVVLELNKARPLQPSERW